jgi:hypothetical protein
VFCKATATARNKFTEPVVNKNGNYSQALIRRLKKEKITSYENKNNRVQIQMELQITQE